MALPGNRRGEKIGRGVFGSGIRGRGIGENLHLEIIPLPLIPLPVPEPPKKQTAGKKMEAIEFLDFIFLPPSFCHCLFDVFGCCFRAGFSS